MSTILVFGNSGSGKSTLAKRLCSEGALAHLDLDTLAWLPTTPPQRKPLAASRSAIEDFIATHDGWVIEGCYADLLDIAAPHASNAIFMNLPVTACVDNAKRRPWEPHKYASKAAQDNNLGMLIEWITRYPTRQDVFSESAHQTLYDNFARRKHLYTHNKDIALTDIVGAL